MQKYKVHLIDRDSDCEVMKRMIISEEQKRLLELLCGLEGIFSEWVKVEILPDEIPYADLT